MKPLPHDHNNFSVLKIVGIYVLFGSLWIYFSDTILGWLVHDPVLMARIAVSKGVLFIVFTAVLLYVLINRYVHRLTKVDGLLLEQEELLDSIAANMPGVIYQFYATEQGEYGVSYVSQRLRDVFELSGDLNQIFPRFVEHLMEEDRVRFLDSIRDVVAAGAPWNFESRFVKPSGEVLWFQGISTPKKENERLLYHGVLLDITERKRAEGEFRESERRLADIIDFLPDAILAIDREGRVIVWNKAIEEMTGFPAESMLGKGDHEYAIPFYGTRRPILINFVSMWDEVIEKQYSFIKKKGDTLFTETNVPFVRGKNRVLWGKAGPLYDTLGNVVGAIESIRDITERKQAEEALFNEKEKLQILSENAPFAMALIAQNGRFLYVNPKYRDIFGYDLTDVPDGRTWFRKAYPSAFYRREVISAWLNDLNGAGFGEQRPRVFSVTCKDGSIKAINFTPVLLSDGDNIMVCEDITERKRLEAQLMNAQKMEAIGTLSGGIAHDFNNILMGIQGYASLMMLDIGPDHPQYERLKRIEEQVKSAADLTGQLLGFARGGKYVAKPVNMNELIEKTSAMFGRTRKEVAIHRKYEGDVWVVEADRGQIEQVLLNLYLNAWQAMPSGGDLSLETKNVAVDEAYAKTYSMVPGRYVRISVGDTGPGMDEKTKERIFEPFFTTKELGRGTGLGLAMVYGIVKNHNGSIEVISEPGRGTTFELYFPSSDKDIVKEEPEVPGIMRGTGTILLVDDEPDVLAVNKEIFESLGYTVHGMRSGEEAIAFYKEKKGTISLIILDMIMPGLSGGETFDRIRELDPSVRVILSSGYSLAGQAQQIMDKGCQGFIQKPFNIALISRKVREVLEK